MISFCLRCRDACEEENLCKKCDPRRLMRRLKFPLLCELCRKESAFTCSCAECRYRIDICIDCCHEYCMPVIELMEKKAVILTKKEACRLIVKNERLEEQKKEEKKQRELRKNQILDESNRKICFYNRCRHYIRIRRLFLQNKQAQYLQELTWFETQNGYRKCQGLLYDIFIDEFLFKDRELTVDTKYFKYRSLTLLNGMCFLLCIQKLFIYLPKDVRKLIFYMIHKKVVLGKLKGRKRSGRSRRAIRKRKLRFAESK